MIELLVSSIEFQGFQYHVHTDFVAKFETVGERFFRTVNFDGYAVDLMFLESSEICPIGESVNEEWRIVNRWSPRVSGNRYRNAVRNLCRYLVVGYMIPIAIIDIIRP